LARFVSVLKDRAHNSLERQEGVHDLDKNLTWTVHEDLANLYGASIDHVREHFKAWVVSDAAKAEQPGWVELESATRYESFIHVDAASLESCKTRPGKCVSN
jgi:hypothetical protein